MNPSIDALKASDGSENATVATVQSVRAPAATTLVVDTVQGINTNFYGTMGTPHTFVDPVTGETITVISEASAVDFRGHVDGTNLEIDEIAPGYTDAGSAVNDIVIIKPTTQWADATAEVLEVSHNDDGTLKVADGGAIDDENGNEQVEFGTTTSAVNHVKHTNAATGNNPSISAVGGDSNVSIILTGKGTGGVLPKIPYKFYAYRNAALNSSNTYTKVAFDTTVYDTSSNLTSHNTFTAPIAGFYRFTAGVGNTSAGSTPQYAALYKNGSRILLGVGANATTAGFQSVVTGTIQLAQGDTIEVYFVGGNASTITVGVDNCYFIGELVSI